MTFQGFWRKCTERKWTPAATASKKTSKWAFGAENKEVGSQEWIKKVEIWQKRGIVLPGSLISINRRERMKDFRGQTVLMCPPHLGRIKHTKNPLSHSFQCITPCTEPHSDRAKQTGCIYWVYVLHPVYFLSFACRVACRVGRRCRIPCLMIGLQEPVLWDLVTAKPTYVNFFAGVPLHLGPFIFMWLSFPFFKQTSSETMQTMPSRLSAVNPPSLMLLPCWSALLHWEQPLSPTRLREWKASANPGYKSKHWLPCSGAWAATGSKSK